MNDLFNKMFGKDALCYEFDKGLKRVVISLDCLPIYQYDHALWEQLFPTVLTSFSFLEQPQSPQAIPASSPVDRPGVEGRFAKGLLQGSYLL